MSNNLCKPVPIIFRPLLILFFLVAGFALLSAEGNVEAAQVANEIGSQAELATAAVSDIGMGEAPEGKPDIKVGYDSLYMTLGIMVVVLLLVILLLLFISANLVNLVRIREGKEAYNFAGTLKLTKEYALNPYIAGAGTFVGLIIGTIILVPIARGVGFSQGYQPDQPIWFSHKIHAGENEIDCQYCHTGANKGKNAWIPAVGVCMNCHKAIKEGKRTGTEEIAKIHYAYENNMPIQWVRIHSLPDLVYFSHQQHVAVGGLECQTCHGPIQEMDKVYQFAPLSMGWCVNCHRETELNKELYKKLGREDVHTVEDIGGLDCARCHY